MINILKLRKMGKEKSNEEKETKPVENPDNEIISLDEGIVIEDKTKKKKESKKSKTKKNAESENPEPIENVATNQEIIETEENNLDTEVSFYVEPEETEEQKTEFIDKAEALRKKLLEELMGFEEEPVAEIEDENPELYGLHDTVVQEIISETVAEENIEEKEPEILSEADRIKKEKEEALKKFFSKAKKSDNEVTIESIIENKPAPVEEPIEVVEQKIELVEEKKITQEAAKPKETEVKQNYIDTPPQSQKRNDIAPPSSEIINNQDKDEKLSTEKTIQVIGFHLGEEIFGFDINYIREINRINNYTKVPNVPDYVDGVINLRGNVIPIINLRTKTKMHKKEFDSKTRVIIIENDNMVVGFIVDEVKEVIRIPESIIMPPPAIAVTETSEYINAVARTENGLIILLDIKKLLSRQDFKN